MNNTVLVIIDGLRSDAISQAPTPTLNSLMKNGASCMDARTVEPSLTLPAHFSAFTSLPPYTHGVVTNTARPDMSAAGQSLFAQVGYNNGSTAAFYSWDHLRNLSLPGSVDVTYSRRLHHEHDLETLAEEAARHISEQTPDFAFVYLEWADIMGHRHGWMSDEYLRAVELCDSALNTIVDAVSLGEGEAWSNLLVISDHGGRGDHHHGDHSDITAIPFIAWGKDVRQGYTIDRSVTILDVAPTIALLMDVRAHPAWEGAPVREILIPRLKPVPMFHIG